MKRFYKIILILFIFSIFSNVFSSSLNGNTIFSHSIGLGQSETHLISNNYNFLNSWFHSRGVIGTPYLLKDMTIFIQLRSDFHFFGNSHGPIGGVFQKINWEREIIWSFDYSDFFYHPHHDFEPLPSGNILIICWEKKTAQEAQSNGRVNVMNEMWPLKIVEIEPNGLDSGTVVWEWHLWDHLVQNVDPSLPNFGVISEHPERIDINLGNFTNPNEGDWLHTNAIDFNPDLDQIVFSSRHLDEIFIIDHSTSVEEAESHIGGNSNMGGDILYRWGNPQNYDRGSEQNKMLNDQHGVNWIEEGDLGSGNLLIFNNNPTDTSGQNNSLGNSSVIEIIPPLNNEYNYDISDSAFGPSNYHWLYGGDETFFSHFQSGAYRLPNNNTIITVSQEKYIFEINDLGQIVWEYFPEIQSGMNGYTARAQKYSLNYFDDILGDMNFDYELNIFDVIILIKMIMENESQIQIGDINQDGIIDNEDVDLLILLITTP